MALTYVYTDIVATLVDADSPITETLMTYVEQDIQHNYEYIGGSGFTPDSDHDHDGVNSKTPVLADNSVTQAKMADDAIGQAELKVSSGTATSSLISAGGIWEIATDQFALGVQVYSADTDAVQLYRTTSAQNSYTEYIKVYNDSGASVTSVTGYWTYVTASKNRVIVYYDSMTEEILGIWESEQPDLPVNFKGEPMEVMYFDPNHPSQGQITRIDLSEDHILVKNRRSESEKVLKKGKVLSQVILQEWEMKKGVLVKKK